VAHAGPLPEAKGAKESNALYERNQCMMVVTVLVPSAQCPLGLGLMYTWLLP